MADAGILIGGDGKGLNVRLLPRFANRHGLIAGATGTGKTVTLQVLAEGLAAQGTPVFLADVKGDLAGLGAAGTSKPHFAERARLLGLPDNVFRAYPALFWDVLGDAGHPVRTTISELGPLLLSRLLELNEVQTGVLNVAFKLADDEGLLLLDLKDLRAMLAYLVEQAPRLNAEYGAVSAASVGAIQRALLVLEQQGATRFLGEPALDLADLMRTGAGGVGGISVLASDGLLQRPRLYATFLIWLLSELYENLPEAGDLERPKLVLFFDEAHLLFDDAPKALVDKVEQVVRLIRSKGVGVWFVTQNPLDVPESVLGQLGNRIQHALRAFTPRDQKAVKVAADTFRPNPKLNTARVITELGIGEVLVSVLDAKGAPTPVERVFVPPPASRVGPLSAEERAAVMAHSPVAGKYDEGIDRESAFERLQGRAGAPAAPADPQADPWGAPAPAAEPKAGPWGAPPVHRGPAPRPEPAPRSAPREAPAPRPQKSLGQTMTERIATNVASSVARSIGSQLGRQIVRGVLGSILKGR